MAHGDGEALAFETDAQFDGWVRFTIKPIATPVFIYAAVAMAALVVAAPFVLDPFGVAHFVYWLLGAAGQSVGLALLGFLVFAFFVARKKLETVHWGQFYSRARPQWFDAGPEGVSTQKQFYPHDEIDAVVIERRKGDVRLVLQSGGGAVLLARGLSASGAEALCNAMETARHAIENPYTA